MRRLAATALYALGAAATSPFVRVQIGTDRTEAEVVRVGGAATLRWQRGGLVSIYHANVIATETDAFELATADEDAFTFLSNRGQPAWLANLGGGAATATGRCAAAAARTPRARLANLGIAAATRWGSGCAAAAPRGRHEPRREDATSRAARTPRAASPQARTLAFDQRRESSWRGV